MKTAAVISYSSYHNPYILPLIKEFRKFVTGDIVVVTFDKFFDGQPDTELLDLSKEDISEVRLKFDPTRTSRWHHNHQRKVGFEAIKGEYDSVFFADCDEIPIGDSMKIWLSELDSHPRDFRFASWWYYRDTCWVGDSVENSLALVSKQSLERANWYHESEREAYSNNWQRLEGWQSKPLVHHYSWAGTKDMLLRKVQSWGHNKDMDWVGMIEDDFAHEFDQCPFRPNWKFTRVEPYIGFTFNELSSVI